ncbi:MAG: hypothetical protein NZM94_15845, partial [Roseiflexus sp.]|nr:hypothetical protein [Roseiflexus sp.]
MFVIQALQPARYCQCSASAAHAQALPALGSVIVIVALPLLCITHCHMLAAQDRTALHPVQFLCHLIPGAGELSAQDAIEVSSSIAPTLRAVYECVAAPMLLIICL